MGAVAFDEGLFNFYRAAIAMRHDSAALRRGEIEFVKTDDPAQFIGYRRRSSQETMLVGLNRGGAPFQWHVPLPAGETAAQVFTASGEVNQVKIEQSDGQVVVTVPALDGVVLRVSPTN